MRKHGFTLIELSIAMGVAAILAASLAPIVIRTVEIKAAEKTIKEVELIQDAARRFYKDNKKWPADLVQLQTKGYVGAHWSLLNPWNKPYQISSTSKTLSVATDTIADRAGMIASRLPQSVINGVNVMSTIGGLTADAIAPGVIVAWSGLIVDIPPGWILCDGANGTPDLRDKFIVGARQDDFGSAKTAITGALTQEGGTIRHNHGGQTGAHVLTIAEIPPHSHGYSKAVIGGRYDGHTSQVVTHLEEAQTDLTGGGQGHVHDISDDMHVPPYYALAFIMKMP